MRSLTFCSPRKMVSLPTMMPLMLLWRLVCSITERISRSLRSWFLSIHAPAVTRSPNSVAMPGTSSTPPVAEYVRMARVSGASSLRSARICAARAKAPESGCAEPSKGA